MSLAIVHSRASAGIEAPPVTIEVHLSKGLPGLSIVGLPETAVKESRHRVRSALMNSGFEFPVRRVTVNLAPADLPKEGGRFDLPIALGILAASQQIPTAILQEYEFAGELALSGEMRPCLGILPFAIATRRQQRQLIIPHANAEEAVLAQGLQVFTANHILEVCMHLTKQKLLPSQALASATPFVINPYLDLSDVQGQAHGRRVLEIAAAGGHSLLMKGPPGAGKTMLASRLPGILPTMTEDEALELAAIYSISRFGFNYRQWRQRPFRAPHHTASSIALVGGGSPPQPGEISLAHQGVLFLDELPEFNRSVLEALREPLEARVVTISRAAYQAEFPAHFQLVAAMNPCPCGYHGDPRGRCHCTQEQVQRYQSKISGPFLDRIDMHLEVHALSPSLLLSSGSTLNESSAVVRQRTIQARDLQLRRQGKANSALSGEDIGKHCALDQNNQALLVRAIDSLGLSARAYHRVLKLARTIADLAASDSIASMHLHEALSYRQVAK